MEHILKHFKKADSILHSHMKNVDFDEWFNPRQKLKTDNHFLALTREIIGQQLSGKAANSIFKRFLDFYGTEQIRPKDLLNTVDEEIRNLGLSWSKVKYIKGLAQKVDSGELILAQLKDLPDENVITTLTDIKGIGPWTAEMFLIFTLGRENVFSYGDLGLKKGIEKIYGIKDPEKEQIETIIKSWEPYKTYGSITLWNSLDNL